MATLKPCPFCGDGLPIIEKSKHFGVIERYSYYVACRISECDILGPSRDSEESAIAAWNNRVSDEAEEHERV